ncbi:MAG: transcriptional repressor [Paludibacteraceae bacterium]|nr:transcriptional repressor [Candidatus Physcocola equi]MCQ2234408.1 transcriptional repressor [Paludibacteraceae bacterium]
MKDIRAYLSEHGIRPSVQRISIMEYLLTHKTHPTVDEMFIALSDSMPTLSKTTLYNTLKLFVDRQVVLMLGLDEKNARFDGDVSPHAHFKCSCCGRVEDIFEDELPELNLVFKNNIGRRFIMQTELSYTGYCSDCYDKRIQSIDNSITNTI